MRMTKPAASSVERISTSGWQSPIEVRQLRAFLAVVEYGSLSAAAQALGLAQSTVSEALAALDRAVGTPTVRRKRGAHATPLTPAGEALLPFARRMLQEIDGLHVAIAEVTRGAQANVTVMANESVSTYILAPALGTLRRRWPKVRFSVTVGTCADIRGAVAAGRFDLGLLLEEAPGHEEDGAVPETVVLSPDVRLVIVGSAAHPLVRQGTPVRRDMLQPFSLLIADSAGDFHQLVRRYFTAEGLPGPQLDSVGSIEAVKRGVAAEPTALGLLPHYAVAEDLAQRRVFPLTLLPAPPRMQLVALTPQPGGAAHAVVHELLAAMRST